jgi:hypothetical protein
LMLSLVKVPLKTGTKFGSIAKRIRLL